MFSQTVEYALRAMAILAQAAPTPKATSEIAKVAKIPPSYLVKILQLLNRAGLVRSQKGIKGGVSLARASDEISILDIVNAVDPIKRIRTCPLRMPAHSLQLCGLHSRLDAALATVETAFAEAYLSEVIALPKAKPACPFPLLIKG